MLKIKISDREIDNLWIVAMIFLGCGHSSPIRIIGMILGTFWIILDFKRSHETKHDNG